MIKDLEIKVPPESISQKNILSIEAAYLLELDLSDINAVIPIKRSLDSRGNKPIYRVLSRVYINEEPQEIYPKIKYEPVQEKRKSYYCRKRTIGNVCSS